MEPLVSTAWLVERLDEPSLRVLECTTVLRRGEGGKGFVAASAAHIWAGGHIPGSAHADLVGELSDPHATLLFTAPSAERFAAGMEALGVGEGTRVVLYDRDGSQWATRLWWLLRAFGFDEAAVLDGGWRTWTAEGREVSTAPAPERPPARFVLRPRPSLLVGKEDVLAALDDPDTCVVNALNRKTHRGDPSSAYARPGHIAGSVNIPADELVDPQTDRLVPRPELAARFADVAAKPSVITSCGGGIAATMDAFVLTLLGHEGVAVYDASLIEWAADDALPMDLGD